tara:strand:+ start:477 stop:1586 length:1110 start_codon:yes stop_codon:yes gene_type:complete
MSLIKETNAQYYSGQQSFVGNINQEYICNFQTDLVATVPGVSNTNYEVFFNNQLQVEGVDYNLIQPNTVKFTSSHSSTDTIIVQLKQFAVANNYGSYAYIKLNDVINNFLVAYVGVGKLIPSVKRTDVMFHAKRCLQEFSYDLLKVIKSQELTIPPNLSIPFPQDYVNYVKISWIDDNGGKHIIYPTRITSAPNSLPIQDDTGIPIQDDMEENVESNDSLTENKWSSQSLTSGIQPDTYDRPQRFNVRGKRYGLQPEEANVNGKFIINERTGCFSFTNNLVGKIIILEYISDGLAYNVDSLIPKMAEEAIYMHIAYSILSTRQRVPEYIVQRFKKNRRAAIHNAKIRLSNIKIEEIAQVMRNKSKWIKH